MNEYHILNLVVIGLILFFAILLKVKDSKTRRAVFEPDMKKNDGEHRSNPKVEQEGVNGALSYKVNGHCFYCQSDSLIPCYGANCAGGRRLYAKCNDCKEMLEANVCHHTKTLSPYER